MSGFDWTPIAEGAGVLVVLATGAIRAGARYVRLTKAVEDNTAAIRDLEKHQEGMMAAFWPTVWRVTTIEDWLEHRDGYHPPRDFNRGEGHQ